MEKSRYIESQIIKILKEVKGQHVTAACNGHVTGHTLDQLPLGIVITLSNKCLSQ